jgi:branched-chain amino acid transport system permease protein
MMNSKPRRIVILFGLGIVLVLLPVIITDTRWHLTMTLICLSAVVALGLYLIAILGLVSFAQAAFYGFGSYTVAILLLKLQIPFWIAWVFGGVLSALIAGVIGMLVLRMKGAYFFLVTLALNQFMVWIFHSWTRVTGGYDGLRSIPPPALLNSPGKVYYLSLGLLVITFTYVITILNSRFGPVLRATTENEVMVQSYGISPFRIRMTNWIACCFFTGLAGGISAILIRSTFPTMFDMMVSLRYLVFLVFGGIASPIGPVIGTAILSVLSEFLTPIKEFEPLVFGSVLVLTLIFLPGGLLGLFRKKEA